MILEHSNLKDSSSQLWDGDMYQFMSQDRIKWKNIPVNAGYISGISGASQLQCGLTPSGFVLLRGVVTLNTSEPPASIFNLPGDFINLYAENRLVFASDGTTPNPLHVRLLDGGEVALIGSSATLSSGNYFSFDGISYVPKKEI